MTFFKTIDKDQINLLKCATAIIVITCAAGIYGQGFRSATLGLLLARFIMPFFWKHKNKARFRRGKYICEFRNKKIDQSLMHIWIFINVSIFIAICVVGSYFNLDPILTFFSCIFVSFTVSYVYQFYIKAPVGVFDNCKPRIFNFRRDPFEKSAASDDSLRNSPIYSSMPGNIYNTDYQSKPD